MNMLAGVTEDVTTDMTTDIIAAALQRVLLGEITASSTAEHDGEIRAGALCPSSQQMIHSPHDEP